MKLSNQAMGSLMMALQKSLLEQTDIVPILKDFDFEVGEGEELVIRNPPTFKIGEDLFAPGTPSEKTKTVGSD